MFRHKWSHGHSIGTGILFGLILSQRPEIIFVAGFATAFIVLGGVRFFRAVIRWIEYRRFTKGATDATRNPESFREWEDVPPRGMRRI